MKKKKHKIGDKFTEVYKQGQTKVNLEFHENFILMKYKNKLVGSVIFEKKKDDILVTWIVRKGTNAESPLILQRLKQRNLLEFNKMMADEKRFKELPKVAISRLETLAKNSGYKKVLVHSGSRFWDKGQTGGGIGYNVKNVTKVDKSDRVITHYRILFSKSEIEQIKNLPSLKKKALIDILTKNSLIQKDNAIKLTKNKIIHEIKQIQQKKKAIKTQAKLKYPKTKVPARWRRVK